MGGNLNRFLIIWAHPAKGRSGPPQSFMTFIPFDATWLKEQNYILLMGEDLNCFLDIWALSVRGGDGTIPGGR